MTTRDQRAPACANVLVRSWTLLHSWCLVVPLEEAQTQYNKATSTCETGSSHLVSLNTFEKKSWLFFCRVKQRLFKKKKKKKSGGCDWIWITARLAVGVQYLPASKCSNTSTNCCLVNGISQDARSFEAKAQREVAAEALILQLLHKKIRNNRTFSEMPDIKKTLWNVNNQQLNSVLWSILIYYKKMWSISLFDAAQQ